MSTKPSIGLRARRGAEEVDMFDGRRYCLSRAGRDKRAKTRANRRDRRAARRDGWTA